MVWRRGRDSNPSSPKPLARLIIEPKKADSQAEKVGHQSGTPDRRSLAHWQFIRRSPQVPGNVSCQAMCNGASLINLVGREGSSPGTYWEFQQDCAGKSSDGRKRSLGRASSFTVLIGILGVISLTLKHRQKFIRLHEGHKLLMRFPMSLTQRIQMQELRSYPFMLFVKLRRQLRTLFWRTQINIQSIPMDQSIPLTNQLQESFPLLRFLLGSGIELKGNPELDFSEGFIRVNERLFGATENAFQEGARKVAKA